MMFIVTLRPSDEKTMQPTVLLVQGKAEVERQTFIEDFDNAVEAARAASPNEWNIDDVYERLRKDGWEFLVESNPLSLEY